MATSEPAGLAASKLCGNSVVEMAKTIAREQAAGLEPIRELTWRRGQSHFAPRTPQNRDSPRRFLDRLLVSGVRLIIFAGPSGWERTGGGECGAAARARAGSSRGDRA